MSKVSNIADRQREVDRTSEIRSEHTEDGVAEEFAEAFS